MLSKNRLGKNGLGKSRCSINRIDKNKYLAEQLIRMLIWKEKQCMFIVNRFKYRLAFRVQTM